jgi:hypothetical protein
MNFAGKFTYTTDTPSGKQAATVVIRDGIRAYEGELLSARGGCELLKNVHTKGDSIFFEAQVGPAAQKITLTKTADGWSGQTVIAQDNGQDVHAKLENVRFEPHKRRALILYATMTRNTEQVALAMKASFEDYNWECNCFRLKAGNDWAAMQKDLYFDDYDVVCLGSPIVAGYPLTIVNKLFSLGAGGQLENNVQKMVDAGKGFTMNHETMGGGPDGVSGAPSDAPAGGPSGPGGPGGLDGAPSGSPNGGPSFRRRACSYPGGPCGDNYQPLGIVFTTYGGGFYGSNESKATLEALKLFLGLLNVSVVGTFACCGKEFGPAGLDEGQKPNLMGPGSIEDPRYYETKDGRQIQGSYFFHNQMWSHPNDRDLLKAKFLVADLVEDYFLTYNGKRGHVASEYISMS